MCIAADNNNTDDDGENYEEYTIAALEGSTPSISMHILIAAVFSTRSTDFNCWMYSQYLSIAADIEASSNNHNYNW